MKPVQNIFNTKALKYKVVRSLVHKGFSIHQLLQFYDNYHAESRISKAPPINECALVSLYDWGPAFEQLMQRLPLGN
jgi:hypothetical protein